MLISFKIKIIIIDDLMTIKKDCLENYIAKIEK